MIFFGNTSNSFQSECDPSYLNLSKTRPYLFIFQNFFMVFFLNSRNTKVFGLQTWDSTKIKENSMFSNVLKTSNFLVFFNASGIVRRFVKLTY